VEYVQSLWNMGGMCSSLVEYGYQRDQRCLSGNMRGQRDLSADL
jgi:hypothetical protein